VQARSDARKRRALPAGFGPIWVTVAIDLVGFGIVLPILPRYAEDLHVSASTIGLIVGSFSLAQLVCAPLLGRLSDRIGRKPVLLLSLAGTAVGSLLTGLAGSVWLLALGRVVDGASGASVSVAQASVTDVAEPAERARLLGLLGAAFGFGFVVGPALGSLAALGGKRLPFFVAAGLAGVNAVVAIRRLPETRPAGSRETPGPIAEQTAADAPAHRRLWVDALPSGVPALIAVMFVALVAFSGFEGTFALLLDSRFGLSLSGTGVVFTVIGVALVIVQGGAIHAVVVRIGEVGTVRAGLAANAAGLLLVAADGRWWTLAPGLALLVIGQGLLSPAAAAAVANRVPSHRRGEVLGFQQSAGSLARFIGPAAAGVLFQHAGVPSPYLAGAALALLALLLVRVTVAPAA
jgi:DHA1 family tetracycline resistance protein-like MFS transporter